MKTQNPFTGRSSGSLANVVASSYNGQNILKSKPLEVRNPKTEKQVNVRQVLASAATLAKSMSAVSGIAKRSARTGRMTQKTARTALLSAILAQKTGTSPNIVLRGAGISLQGFGISAQSGVEASLNHTTGEFTVEWSPVLPVGGLSTDSCTVAVFDLVSGVYQTFPSTVTRQAAQVTMTVTDATLLATNTPLAFIMFDNADGTAYDSIVSVGVTVE